VYTLDTNAIIYYVKDDPRAVPILQGILISDTTPLYVSTITEAELFGFSSLTDSEATMINDLLRGVSLIPVDSHIARTAGRIRATYRLKLADSIIAATTLFTGSTLLTRNTRDFKKVPTLSVQAL
jgi:predicted nucleic acid-binding protein